MASERQVEEIKKNIMKREGSSTCLEEGPGGGERERGGGSRDRLLPFSPGHRDAPDCFYRAPCDGEVFGIKNMDIEREDWGGNSSRLVTRV